jgi:hypothetical protein
MYWIKWLLKRWRVSERNRQKFEKEYHDWLLSVARDEARSLANMPMADRELVVRCYKQLLDPRTVFRKLFDPRRLERLAGDKISNYIVVETEAVTFFPSIHSTIPGILDFAVAMNRRFFYRDMWFPIIALNSEYIRQSSDRILGFTLEHEFEMSRIYQQISVNLRALSSDEKSQVAISAQQQAAARLQITQSELIEDEKLMIRLSKFRPLIPKPYAETALLGFLEDYFPDLRSYGIPSESDDERSFGTELYEEFHGWTALSKKTYASFVRELLADLREFNRGYV